MTKHILIFFCFLLVSLTVSASHLLGGTITYKYVSSTADKVTYLISIPIYRDCSEGHVELDSSIKIGIYYNSKSKSLYKSESIALVSRTVLALKCSFTFTGCVELGTYAKYVTLDTNYKGYFISYSRCCRALHTNITNESAGATPDINGFTFLTYMAPTKYMNNAPQFIFNPTLLNGVNSENEDNWGAMDTDGDSLVYEIVAPYQGGTNNIPIPEPTPTLKDPISVKYFTGYNYLKPFGNDGTISIDRFTGKLIFSNSITGTFAFCVEIKEYRKGNLIGIYRRDYPLIFINLPPDPFGYNIFLSTPQLWASKFVRLYWDICPINATKFSIERKQKLTNWVEIVTLETDKYYDDSIPLIGRFYYRVKATLDGKEVVSNIDSASFEPSGLREFPKNQIMIYPNPSINYLHIIFPSILGYSVYDITGKILMESKEVSNASELKIDVRSLSPGLYFIALKTEKGTITQRFVKE